MRKFFAIAALGAALSFVPATAEANCRPLRSVARVVAAPVRAVVRAQPLRRVARLAIAPVRGVRAVRAARACN